MVNSESGNRIARGIPGNPPPVPMSMILVPGRKSMTFAIEGNEEHDGYRNYPYPSGILY